MRTDDAPNTGVLIGGWSGGGGGRAFVGGCGGGGGVGTMTIIQEEVSFKNPDS